MSNVISHRRGFTMRRSTKLFVLVLAASGATAFTSALAQGTRPEPATKPSASAAAAPANAPAPAAAELRKLLEEFLAGASRNDAAAHERFWADDLIYTRSAGVRMGKAEILENARSGPTTPPAEPTLYSAEDVRIQQYGDSAVVAFRLVGKTVEEGKPVVMQFLNTGTFVKRNGEWRVVAWQSTRVPDAQGQEPQPTR
jgi:ketosteroid isomerase-like protein